MKKKKILLIGPIGDFGGRELEVGFIAKALNEEFDVKICSTVYFTKESQVFDFVTKKQLFSLANTVINKNYLIKLVSLIAYFRFGCRYSISYFFNNKINKKYFEVTNKTNRIIEELVVENDLIIICAQISSAYMNKVVRYAFVKNIPVIFRTTGTIVDLGASLLKSKFSWLEKVTCFIHHSETNANKLTLLNKHDYEIIDQCAYNEKELLACLNKENKISNFFVLSRLSKEKQIDVVIKAFSNIGQPTDYLHIYGTGPELIFLKELAKNNSNVIFYGHISHAKSHELFYKYDCLIISSSEEAGPLTGVEAMAAGMSLISTKVGAMPERLIDYDFWYDGSQEQLEVKMLKFKGLPISEVNRISKTVKQRYVEEYSIEAIKNKYRKLVGKTIF